MLFEIFVAVENGRVTDVVIPERVKKMSIYVRVVNYDVQENEPDDYQDVLYGDDALLLGVDS